MSSIEKKSPIWQYFEIKNENTKYAACLLCSNQISRGGKRKKAGTTGLSNHLKSKHPENFNSLKNNKGGILVATPKILEVASLYSEHEDDDADLLTPKTEKLYPYSSASTTFPRSSPPEDFNDVYDSTQDSTVVDNSNTSLSTLMSNTAIQAKILNGQFKINQKRGRSKVWNIFGKIENEFGEELSDVVACRICSNIYKHNKNTTSNLVRHKCYATTNAMENENITKIQADTETKQKAARVFTEWTIENCRPFKIVEDSGMKKVAEFLISVGAKCGEYVDVNSLLPHPTTISQNTKDLYNIYLKQVKGEISHIKNNGFGLTSDLWTDNFLRRTYIAVTMHYIKKGVLVNRLLGIKSMEGEKCTSENIGSKVINLLKEFHCDLNDRAIIVTDRGSNMVAAFRSYNHLYCIDHLLHNTLQKSMQEVTDVAELCRLCTKLVKYFKVAGINSALKTTLNSFSPNRWNTMYYIFVSIERNWAEIVQILQEKNELNRIDNINLNQISAIVKILEPFEDTFKKMEGETYPTIHLTFVYINRLKKKCGEENEDSDIIKQLKEKLRMYLETVVMQNLKIFHKIALFLFPPANKLIQFDEDDKALVKDECKRIMQTYMEEDTTVEHQSHITLSSSTKNSELFSDFVQQPEILNSDLKIQREIMMYESSNTIFYDDFNILQWWELHKNEFPLLYKMSCNILATPASCAASERVFSVARNLISEKRSSIGSSSISVNQIMFLHSNINKSDISNELQKQLTNN